MRILKETPRNASLYFFLRKKQKQQQQQQQQLFLTVFTRRVKKEEMWSARVTLLLGEQGHPPSLKQNKQGLNLLLFDVLIAVAVVVA